VAGEVVAEGEGSSRISEIPQKSHDEAGSLSLCGKIPTATFLPIAARIEDFRLQQP
jgi:hypothetical protein